MLRQIEMVEEEKRALIEEGKRKEEAFEKHQLLLEISNEKSRTKELEIASETDRLSKLHSIEVYHLQLRVRDLTSQNNLLSSQLELKNSEIELRSKALMEKDAVILGISEQLTKAREYLGAKNPVSYCTTLGL
jgi:hypothetical protein